MRGRAIDIGAGSDGLSKYQHLFPMLDSVKDYDLQDGDAQIMAGVETHSYDLVHSSHCLEHVRDPWVTLKRWWEILKPGGHLVVVIPEFYRYEQAIHQFPPSDFNPDHKSGFTTCALVNTPVIQNVPLLLNRLAGGEIQRIELLDWTMPEGWEKKRSDYSQLPDCEPSIEFVVRKL